MAYELKVKTRKQGERFGLLAVVYGPEVKENKLISLGQIEFEKLYEAAGESSIINLIIDDEKKPREVLVKAVDRAPVTDIIRHVDFYQIKAGQKLEVEAKLAFTGEAPAVKDLGGILVTNLNTLKIRCLAKDIVSEISVPLGNLQQLNDRIAVKDLNVPAGIEVLNSPDDVVAIAAAPEEEKEEAVPTAEAAAPTAGAEATAAKPEDAAPTAEAKKDKKDKKEEKK